MADASSRPPDLPQLSRMAIRAGQTRALYQQGLAGTFGNLVVATATIAFVAPQVTEWWRFIPLMLVFGTYLERIFQVRSYKRVADDDEAVVRLQRRIVVSAVVAGSFWGANALLLMPVLEPFEQLFVIIVGIGLAAGGLATLGEVLTVFLGFALPILLMTLLAVLLSLREDAELLGPLMGVYIVVLVKTSLVHARSLRNALALSLQNAALARSLEEASQKAQAASRAKSEFLARMSHEIRTPMNGVLGTTELLEDALLPEREHHLAVLAHRSSELLLTLLNDVLDMARIEAGRIEVHEATMSIEGLLEDVATMFSVRADQKGLTVVCHADREVPTAMLGDETRLRQVLMNLTGNAVKFTERGEIEVHARVDGDDVLFDVRDSGVGIPAEHHEAIFRSFEQVGRASHPQIRGTGLGLAISARLTELMGGRIEVESAVGVGSCFTVRVPLRVPSGHQPRPRAAVLAGARAVVCVPHPLEREVISGWLREAGAEVRDCPERTSPTPCSGADFVVLDPSDLRGEDLSALVAGCAALVLERPSARLEAQRWSTSARHPFPLPLQRERLVQAAARLRTDRAAAAATPRALAPTTRRDVRVLVVDDDAVNRMVAEHMLSRLGVETSAAPDGEAALQLLATTGYDLVFLDLGLPGIDGAEVSRRTRTANTLGRDGERLPIVALTAHVLAQHREYCYAAGMDAILTKPLTLGDLGAILVRFGLLESKSASPAKH